MAIAGARLEEAADEANGVGELTEAWHLGHLQMILVMVMSESSETAVTMHWRSLTSEIWGSWGCGLHCKPDAQNPSTLQSCTKLEAFDTCEVLLGAEDVLALCKQGLDIRDLHAILRALRVLWIVLGAMVGAGHGGVGGEVDEVQEALEFRELVQGRAMRNACSLHVVARLAHDPPVIARICRYLPQQLLFNAAEDVEGP
eukprot:12372259-Alexandrium_andersonii.AAC.1